MSRSRARARRQFTGVDLIAARFFIAKAGFNVEAQAVLVPSGLASVGSELPTNQRSSGWSSRQARARWTGPTAAPKIDTSWKNRSCPAGEQRSLMAETGWAPRWIRVSPGNRKRSVPPVLPQVVKQSFMHEAAIGKPRDYHARWDESTYLVEHQLIGFKTNLSASMTQGSPCYRDGATTIQKARHGSTQRG